MGTHCAVCLRQRRTSEWVHDKGNILVPGQLLMISNLLFLQQADQKRRLKDLHEACSAHAICLLHALPESGCATPQPGQERKKEMLPCVGSCQVASPDPIHLQGRGTTAHRGALDAG